MTIEINNNMNYIEYIPEDLGSCHTTELCKRFMIAHNELNPLIYFRMALVKLELYSNSFTEEQKQALQFYIELEENTQPPDHVRGWETYCDILSVEQIQIVGF